MSTVKRFFLYTVAIITLGIFSQGISLLLGLVFRLLFTSDSWRDFAVGQLSLGLAMVIIGGVLWAIFWRIIQRATSGQPTETGSGIRKLYINLILLYGSISGLVSFGGFFAWAAGGSPYDYFPSEELAMGIVSAGLWLYHSRLENAEGQPSYVAKLLRRWYVYILSAFGLVTLIFNTVQVFNTTVAYLISSSDYAVQSGLWHEVLSEHVIWVITGGLAWWYFWFRMAKGDFESTLRHVYLYLLPIAGGAVTTMAALSSALYYLLRLAFNSSIKADFGFLGWTIPAALIGFTVWVFHRKLVDEESVHLTLDRQSPRRLYMYLMSFIGLGTILSGVVYLFSLLFNLLFTALSSETVYAAGWWGNQVSLALALLLVGIPVWIYFWRQILKTTGEGNVAERSARSRRIYIYLMLGISIIAAVTTLVMAIYQVINAILQGDFGQDLYRNLVWSLSVLLMALPVLMYHWRLLREDQELGAEKTVRRKRVNVVAVEDAGELVARIEANLGYRVRTLRYTGDIMGQTPAISDEDMERLAEQIAEAGGDGIIIDLTGAEVKILPFEDA